MHPKKALLLLVSILLIFLIPVILYIYSFNAIAFDEGFYKKEFSKHGVYSILEAYDVDGINADVLKYLRIEKEENLIDNPFFVQREKEHLLDVKSIVQRANLAYYFSLILLIALLLTILVIFRFSFRLFFRRALSILALGSILTLFITLLFFILSSLNFDFLFEAFHKSFFSVGTYSFNPEFEKIVVLYPENLFFDALAAIIAKAFFSSVILFSLSIFVLFVFFRINFFNILLKILDGKYDK